MPFIAPPPAPKPKIPPITASQLADALVLYIKSLIEFEFVDADVDYDRSLRSSTIVLYGPVVPNMQGHRQKIEADVYGGKTVRALSSKLGADGMVVSLTGRYLDFKQDVYVEPQAKRSIAIFKVTKLGKWRSAFCARLDRPRARRRFDGCMRPTKITFGEMRAAGVRGVLVYATADAAH